MLFIELCLKKIDRQTFGAKANKFLKGEKSKVKTLQWMRSPYMAAKAFEYFYRLINILPFWSLSPMNRKFQVRFLRVFSPLEEQGRGNPLALIDQTDGANIKIRNIASV